eukprot:3135684-Amphidinium_carterae.1
MHVMKTTEAKANVSVTKSCFTQSAYIYNANDVKTTAMGLLDLELQFKQGSWYDTSQESLPAPETQGSSQGELKPNL